MKTIQTTVYTAAELSPRALDIAYDNWAATATDFENWADCVKDDAKEIGKLLGIDRMKIWYSGFSSQGDGACFTGFYSYAKDCVKAVKAYAPLDTELHSIAQRLQDVQRRHFYGLTANLTHGGRYYHENSISFDVTDGMHEYSNLNADTEDTICEALRDFMRWIYSSLGKEYEYQTSMAAFLECAEANEYEFTENGRRA